MDVLKYEINFECWPGCLTSEQSEYLLYKKNSPTAHKNRAVYSNAFHNRHVWDYHEQSHM